MKYSNSDDESTESTPDNEPAEGDEPVSIFLTKNQLPGPVKEGDSISGTVKSVDPEDGSVEIVLNNSNSQSDEPSHMMAFDKAMRD